MTSSWRILTFAAFGAALATGFASGASPALALVLPLPAVRPVPDDGRLPLASALYQKGAEYSDLNAAGYVEEEFYLSGAADAINAADGSVAVAAQPYVTRILVRRPRDAKRFSGTAVVEPFSFAGERAGGWTKIRQHLLAHGDAWIGITLIAGDKPSPNAGGSQGLQQLKTYDPVRYDPLQIFAGKPGQFMRATTFTKGVPRQDGFAPQGEMILGELATLVKSNAPTSPLKGLVVKRFYTLTWQVQAQLWMDYLSQGRHQQWRLADGRPLIDAYMLGNYSGDMPIPADLPKDALVVVVRSVRETSNNARDGLPQSPDSDAPRVRVYDFNGSAHIGSRDVGSGSLQMAEQQLAAGAPTAERPPRAPRPAVCISGTTYDEPVEPVISAIFARMDDWSRTGKPMPRAPRVVTEAGMTVKDQTTGIALGGLRPPWIEAPAASYLVGDEVGCGANDVKTPYTAAQLKARYGDYNAYVQAYDKAKAHLIQDGLLLPEDLNQVRPIAGREAFDSPR